MPIKQKLVFLAPVNQSNLVAKVLESLETSEIQMSPSIRQRMLNSLQSGGEVVDRKWHWCQVEAVVKWASHSKLVTCGCLEGQR